MYITLYPLLLQSFHHRFHPSLSLSIPGPVSTSLSLSLAGRFSRLVQCVRIRTLVTLDMRCHDIRSVYLHCFLDRHATRGYLLHATSIIRTFTVLRYFFQFCFSQVLPDFYLPRTRVPCRRINPSRKRILVKELFSLRAKLHVKLLNARNQEHYGLIFCYLKN